MDLFEEIKGILVKELSLDKELITPDADMTNDLGVDSYSLIRLAETIEGKYGVELQLDDLVEFENIGDLVKFVETNK